MGICEKKVADQNTSFKIHDVHKLCVTMMNSVSPTLWENCVEHVKELENKHKISDERLELELEPLIINIDGGDSSDKVREE